MRLVAVFFLLSYSCWGQELLGKLQETLQSMRSPDARHLDVRGATPQLSVAKHLLRDWVEMRLSAMPQPLDEHTAMLQLNGELSAAGVFCGECDGGNNIGFVDKIRLLRRSGFLVLITGVGIQMCSFDESVYVYDLTKEGWHRVWQNEQTDYKKEAYKPQYFVGVEISPFNAANSYLVLTLGNAGWCSSNWHDHYYRVFRMGPSLERPPLVEGTEWGFVGTLQGIVDSDQVLFEYSVGSIDGGVWARNAVRAYREKDGGLERMDPLALSPRDFVEEWLTHPWKEVGDWSEARGPMREWHERLPKDGVRGEFEGPTKHCPSKPDLWQIRVNGLIDANSPTYFVVRWRPPYNFSMVEVRSTPLPICSEPDPEADRRRTLFPGRSGGLP